MPRISVTVKPGCRSSSQAIKTDDGYLVYLHAHAHGGEANAELMQVLSKELGVAKTLIRIVSGERSHHKIIEY